MKNSRSMKIHGASGYRYEQIPAIVLKGKWLADLNFDIGGYVSVACENGRIVITPDLERAAVEGAEAAFMEKETKLLKKRFKEDKEKLVARYVAERTSKYGRE